MRTVYLMLLIAAMLSMSIAQQSQPATLTLTKSIATALERNLVVKRAQYDVEQSQSGVTSAYGNFMPTVSMGASWSGGEQYLNGVPLGSSDQRSFGTSLNARMTIFDGFANTSSFAQATAQASASEYALGRTRQSVTAQTMRLYYEVLRTRKLLAISQQTVDYDRQQLDRVKETARLGSASLVNVYQQQAQVGQDEVRLVQAQNDHDLAKANLVAFLALDIATEYDIADASIPDSVDRNEYIQTNLDLANFGDVSRQAFGRRLDFQSALEEFRATDAGVTSARSGFLPSLTANASYGYNGRTQLEQAATSILPAIPYESEFSTFKKSSSLNWSFSLSLPLFSGFKTSETVQRAQIARRNAEEGLRDSERKIQVEVRTAMLQLGAAEKNYEASIKSLEYQQQNLRVNQEKYNVGSGTLLDLLFAQNNFNSALTSKINAVYQYLSAKSQLDLALGTIQQ